MSPIHSNYDGITFIRNEYINKYRLHFVYQRVVVVLQ